MGYIYKITNILNNKNYIGKTNHIQPYDRFKEHIKDSHRERCKNRPLYRAFNKYGIENFTFEILEKTNNTSEREKYYIKFYNSYGSTGYNATFGGDGKEYLDLDDNKVIKYHITDGNFQLCKTSSYFKVDKGTIATILKRNNVNWLSSSNSQLQSIKDIHGSILQIDPTTLKVVNTYNSRIDANLAFGKSKYNNNIKDVCKNRKNRCMAYGYYWCYEKEYDDFIKMIS